MGCSRSVFVVLEPRLTTQEQPVSWVRFRLDVCASGSEKPSSRHQEEGSL